MSKDLIQIRPHNRKTLVRNLVFCSMQPGFSNDNSSFDPDDNHNINFRAVDLSYQSVFMDISADSNQSDSKDDWFTDIMRPKTIIDEFDYNAELFLPQSLLSEIDTSFCSNNNSNQFSLSNESNPKNDTNKSLPESYNLEIILNQDPAEAKESIFRIVSLEINPKNKGRILRTAAEIAKKKADVSLSLELYEMLTEIDPLSPSSWIDRAKLLDELGQYNEADSVLQNGIYLVPHCELLLRKLLKSFEKSSKIEYAREFLGSLINHPNIDGESVLPEGAIFEIRQGQLDLGFTLIQQIKEKSSWKPNIYGELCQFFEKDGTILDHFDIVEEGFRLNPRNAILCQSLIQNQKDPNKIIEILEESRKKWTSEFNDKMIIIACEVLAQLNCFSKMRLLFAETLFTCSEMQRYKLFFSEASTELWYGDSSFSIPLLQLALNHTPYKARSMVLILMAKIFEIEKKYDDAFSVLNQASIEFSGEWRVFLEFALFFVHQNKIINAIEILDKALVIHNSSGRLWAFRVQLEAFNSIESQIAILQNAIQAVPKSGEVWCEAARISLNPATKYFNLQTAKQFLEFAFKFTSQHGDSLIEMIRIELLEKGLSANLDQIRRKFVYSEGHYGFLFTYFRKLVKGPLIDVFNEAIKEIRNDVYLNRKIYSQAISRSSFTIRSIAEEEERYRKMSNEIAPSSFAFGITTIGKLITDSSLCETKEQLLSIVLGNSASSQ